MSINMKYMEDYVAYLALILSSQYKNNVQECTQVHKNFWHYS